MAFDDGTEFVLEKLRRKLRSEPEYLFERPASGYVPNTWNIYADLIGFDDELVDAWRLPDYRDVLLVPLRTRATMMAVEKAPFAPSFRVAEYHATSCRAQMNLSGEAVAGMGLKDTHVTDMTQNLSIVCLIRYRRRPISR